MVTIRSEVFGDIDAREDLLDRVWGAARFQKTAERLREGRCPADGLSLVAEHDGDVVGSVQGLARLRRAGPAGLAARPPCRRRGMALPWDR